MSTPDQCGVESSGHRADPGIGQAEQTNSETVPVSVLVDEAADAGMVEWLADRVVDDQVTLSGEVGLLPALAEAARRQVATAPVSVHFTVTWDPTSAQLIAVDCAPGCMLATVRDVCVLIAATCTNLRPSVSIVRNDQMIQSL